MPRGVSFNQSFNSRKWSSLLSFKIALNNIFCILCVQIYIGGDYEGVEMLADQPAALSDPNWTLTPGAVVEEVCDAPFEALHFIGITLDLLIVPAKP